MKRLLLSIALLLSVGAAQAYHMGMGMMGENINPKALFTRAYLKHVLLTHKIKMNEYTLNKMQEKHPELKELKAAYDTKLTEIKQNLQDMIADKKELLPMIKEQIMEKMNQLKKSVKTEEAAAEQK
jgi:hypothetical protein